MRFALMKGTTMKNLNWLEMLNRLYLVVWIAAGSVMTSVAVVISLENGRNLLEAVGIFVAAWTVPPILRAVVRWVYAGLQTKKTG